MTGLLLLEIPGGVLVERGTLPQSDRDAKVQADI